MISYVQAFTSTNTWLGREGDRRGGRLDDEGKGMDGCGKGRPWRV